jgi:uncharacterized membrane protein
LEVLSAKRRIDSIDLLRGAVMIIMALDHVRDYFHYTASTDSPTNLATTTPALFFTRFITHFCAPTFVFLAGISAQLTGLKKSKGELAIFLIKRGIWLVFIELLIVSLGWTFNPLYNVLILQVIWAIGISMIMLGLLVRLSSGFILVLGLLIICFHNLLDYAEVSRHGNLNVLWDLAHYGKFMPVHLFTNHIALIVYPFLPWTGIMMTGYGIGRLFTNQYSAESRRKILLSWGFGTLILFVVIRFINLYGDPSGWQTQKNLLFTIFSFINLTKYPPSLDYILMTIGVAMILLGCLERNTGKRLSFVRIFGRVPFFFYVLHIYLIHLICVIFFFAEHYPAKDIDPQHSPFMFRPDKFGFGLEIVYLIWIGVILILFPLCKWYNNYKSSHRQWWLSYL